MCIEATQTRTEQNFITAWILIRPQIPTFVIMKLLSVYSLCVASSSGLLLQESSSPNEVVAILRQFHFDDFKQVLFGVLEGSLGHEVDLAETCINEGEDAMQNLEEAVNDIMEGTEESVQEGIQLLGQVVQEATQDLQDCELAAEDIDRLIDMSDILSHPLSFLYNAGKNIIINHVEIFDEIDEAIDDWQAIPPDYNKFGFNIGSAMKLILEGADDPDDGGLVMTDDGSIMTEGVLLVEEITYDPEDEPELTRIE